MAFDQLNQLWYDMEGNAVSDPDEVSKLFEDPEYRIVAKDEIGDVTVSTVLLMIDHNWGGEGPPIIFETMIFGGKLDNQMWRYATREEAEIGHREAVEMVSAMRFWRRLVRKFAGERAA